MQRIKNTIIGGTIILSTANLLTRILGFLYQVYISRKLGPEGMGVIQLALPVFMVTAALVSSGIPLAVSRLTALNYRTRSSDDKFDSSILKKAITIAILLSAPLGIILFIFAEPISIHLLGDIRCSLALSVFAPLPVIMALSAAIKGWFLGKKRIYPTAFAEIVEQIIRISVVILTLNLIAGSNGYNFKEAAALITFGMLAGEAAGLAFILLCRKSETDNKRKMHFYSFDKGIDSITGRLLPIYNSGYNDILKIAVPVTLARLLSSLLNGVNAVIIPRLLIRFGLTAAEATSEYGLLIGMALPLIFMPFIVTGALSRVLIPGISEAADNSKLLINRITKAFALSIAAALYSTAILYALAIPIGEVIYHQARVGEYVRMMSYTLLPLNLSVISSSMLNALGKQKQNAVFALIGGVLQLAMTVILVPMIGITGFITGFMINILTGLILRMILLKMEIGSLGFLCKLMPIPILTAAAGMLLIPLLYSGLTSISIINEISLLLCAVINLPIYLIWLGFLNKNK